MNSAHSAPKNYQTNQHSTVLRVTPSPWKSILDRMGKAEQIASTAYDFSPNSKADHNHCQCDGLLGMPAQQDIPAIGQHIRFLSWLAPATKKVSKCAARHPRRTAVEQNVPTVVEFGVALASAGNPNHSQILLGPPTKHHEASKRNMPSSHRPQYW